MNAATKAAIVASFIAGTIGLIVLLVWLERRRVRRAEDHLRWMGYRTCRRGDRAGCGELWSRVGLFRDLPRAAKGVALGGHKDDDTPLPLVVLEHRYSTGAGKTQQVVVHSIIACPAPRAWPALVVRRRRLRDTFSRLFAAQDLRLESEEFNRAWHVGSDDPDFALLFLGEEIQHSLAAEKKQLEIRVGEGVLAIAQQGRLDPVMIELLDRRLRWLLASLPAELAGYESPPRSGSEITPLNENGPG